MASLSGPDSRRRLGTQSGAMRREARRLSRDGYDRAAGALALGASEQRLSEGSAISSAEGNAAFDSKRRRLGQGLMEAQRRAALGGEEAAPAPTAVAPAAKPAAAPTLSRTDFYANQRQNRMNQVGPETGVPGSSRVMQGPPTPTLSRPTNATPAPTITPGPMLFGMPASLWTNAATATTATPQREGRIDGMPASRAIAEAGRPAPQFGADIAKRNLASGGLSSAVADYQRRASAPPVAPATPEPGNMRELGQSLVAGPPDSRRAQRALDGWRAEQPATLAGPPRPITPAGPPAPAPTLAGPPAPLPMTGPQSPVAQAGPPVPQRTLTPRLNAKFYGPEGAPNLATRAELDRQKAERDKRLAADKKRQSGSSGPQARGLLTRTTGRKLPSFLEGTIAGDAINQ